MIPEAQRLDALAERLRAVDPLMPSPNAKIRAWNLVSASLEQSPVVRRSRGSLGRLILAAGAAAVLLVGGAVAASAGSLPDSPFYPVKGVLEQLQGDVTFGAGDRLNYHLDLAQTRLTEAEAMIARHRVDLANQALAAMDSQLEAAAAIVSSETDAALASSLGSRLQQAIAVHLAQLDGMQGQVTNPTARAAIADAQARAQQALQTANGSHANGNPGSSGQTNQGQGQGTTQGDRGSGTPHPTPKK